MQSRPLFKHKRGGWPAASGPAPVVTGLIVDGVQQFSSPNTFDNFGAWSFSSITPTAGESDPFGGTGAWLWPTYAATDQFITAQAAPLLLVHPGVFSIYAKAGTVNFLGLGRSTDSGTTYTAKAVFNLATGAVESSSGVTATGIVPYGNGWYRVSITIADVTNGPLMTYSVGDTAAHAVPGTPWTAAGTETIFAFNLV